MIRYLLLFLLPLSAAIDLTGKILYLRPSTDDLYFTVKGPGVSGGANPPANPQGDLIYLKPSLKVGYRLEAKYSCSFLYTRVGWETLDGRSSRKVKTSGDGQVLWNIWTHPVLTRQPTRLFRASAISSLHIDYDSAFLDVGTRLFCYNCASLSAFVGLRYARIHFRNRITYFGEQTSITNSSQKFVDVNRSDAWGVGPQIGLEAGFALSPCWEMEGWVLAALLYGRGHPMYTANPIDVRSQYTSRCMLFSEMGIGVRYNWRCTSLGFGYRFTYISHAIDVLIFPDDVADGINYVNASPFTLSGFYFSLNVNF